jgi:hypothetical protein
MAAVVLEGGLLAGAGVVAGVGYALALLFFVLWRLAVGALARAAATEVASSVTKAKAVDEVVRLRLQVEDLEVRLRARRQDEDGNDVAARVDRVFGGAPPG